MFANHSAYRRLSVGSSLHLYWIRPKFSVPAQSVQLVYPQLIWLQLRHLFYYHSNTHTIIVIIKRYNLYVVLI